MSTFSLIENYKTKFRNENFQNPDSVQNSSGDKTLLFPMSVSEAKLLHFLDAFAHLSYLFIIILTSQTDPVTLFQ